MTERTTTAGVAEENGLFLVAQRMPGGPLSEKWEFVGGKNRYGETIEDTLKREWKEELDVDITVGDFLLETEFVNKNVHYRLRCHRVYLTQSEMKLHVHERTLWVDKTELALLDFGPSDSVIRDYVLKNL